MIFRYGVYLLRDVEDYSGSFVSSIVGNLLYIVSIFLVLLLGEEGEEMTRLVNSAITFARGKRLGLIRCQLRPKGPFIASDRDVERPDMIAPFDGKFFQPPDVTCGFATSSVSSVRVVESETMINILGSASESAQRMPIDYMGRPNSI